MLAEVAPLTFVLIEKQSKSCTYTVSQPKVFRFRNTSLFLMTEKTANDTGEMIASGLQALMRCGAMRRDGLASREAR
jgi:hypothetical protein